MVTIQIYVEGGGDNNKALASKCRHGFAAFFKKAGFAGRMPTVVACGARNRAFQEFRRALRNASDTHLPLLLVDSEGTVASGNGPWQHLYVRDNWTKPAGAGDDHVYLMVQCMEAWFLADPDTLANYFGPDFQRDKLPRHTDLAAVDPEGIVEGLRSASRMTSKGKYDKGSHSFDILGLLIPERVRQRCPEARRLIEFMENQ